MGTCCQGKAPDELEDEMEFAQNAKVTTPIDEPKSIAIHTPSDVDTEKKETPQQLAPKGAFETVIPSESDLIVSPSIETQEEEEEKIQREWMEKYKELQHTMHTQTSNYDKEIDARKQEIESLKREKLAQMDTIQSLKGKQRTLAQVIHEPHSKPSFHKKSEEQRRVELANKDKEIQALKDELNALKSEHKKLENEMKTQKDEHDAIITKANTLNTEEIESLQSRLKAIDSQHTIDKETHKKEMKLLKDKDPQFIQKIYDERDELKGDLMKLKKLFKQREHTLRIELESLERRKIKAEDLADLAYKNEDELRDIIERLRFTNRDLSVTIREHKTSHEKREKEYEEQIAALNRIIKKKKSDTKRSSQVSKLVALGSLTGQTPVPSKAPNKSNKFGGIAASLAGKLPFGNKGIKSKDDEKAKSEEDDGHKDDIKGKIGDLLTQQTARSGQGPITDDTKSILGMIDTMQKYQKMKKIGMPMHSIKNKMKLDGFNDTQIAKFAGEPPPKALNGIDLTKHDLKKYTKMKKIGLPEESVRNKMKMDGIDSKVIATYFGEKIESDAAAGQVMQAPCPKPDVKKYERMKKIGLPDGSVRNKMKMDGVDEYWVRDFFGEAQPIIGGATVMQAPTPKPNVSKYTKMQKVGLPAGAIKNKMKKDGIDPYWVRDFFGEAQPVIEEEKEMPQPCPKPDFSKYERMKKVGLPPPPIKNKMQQDGIHKYWICVFFGEPIPKIKTAKKKKKLKRTVKPLHWRKKSECDWSNTIWAEVDVHIELKVITTQTLITPELIKVLESAFTSVRPKKDKKKKDKKKDDGTKEITLIAPKRAFNMIVGLRQFEKLGINDLKIRNYLLKLDDSHLTVEMLENLSKFVPNNEELTELRNFKGDKTRLGRAEKFVDVMSCLVDIKMRIDLWEFKIKFKENVFEIESRINQITNTLNALKSSPQIGAFLKVCLIIGNFLNEGTNRGGAKGIKLESIDRFASLKTADNKQTMLMFILDHIAKHKMMSGFDTFPSKLMQMVEDSKKIEAKTIRDGVNDMDDALQRIGKRVTRTARHIQQIQAHFHKSAGNALKVLGKLRQNASKLHDAYTQVQKQIKPSKTAVKMSDENDKKQGKKKCKRISFVDGIFCNHKSGDSGEKYSKYRTVKAAKFIIIDADYKGTKKIRKRKAREIVNVDEETVLTRGETMIDSDGDYSDFEAGQSKASAHHKTQTGLRRKKKRLKKVKIRRMHRVGRRGDMEYKQFEAQHALATSRKTLHTIRKLRQTKRSDTDLAELTTALSGGGVSMRSGHARGVSIVRKTELEDVNHLPSDKFESVMTGFHTMACNKVEALNICFSNLKIFAGNVAVYFGEHDDLEWEQLFQMFVVLFAQIDKAKTHNLQLVKKQQKEMKKKERQRLKKERMAKKGLAPIGNSDDDAQPTNILEEIHLKNAKGTLSPSRAKDDIVGYKKVAM
eukprot:223477_1